MHAKSLVALLAALSTTTVVSFRLAPLSRPYVVGSGSPRTHFSPGRHAPSTSSPPPPLAPLFSRNDDDRGAREATDGSAGARQLLGVKGGSTTDNIWAIRLQVRDAPASV